MRALFFNENGIDNLKYGELPEPSLTEGEVLIKVVKAGVTQLDYMTVSSMKVSPLPHVPGSEFAGIVEEVKGKASVNPGDKVAVYTRTFDGTCSFCREGKEMLCTSGKRIGIDENGGYAEYVKVPSNLVVKADLHWDLMASLSISALAPYHALKEARVGKGATVVVFGASGSTGIFATQLAEIMGATVVAVTDHDFKISRHTVSYSQAEDYVRALTDGEMADVVVNPLGAKYWDLGVRLLRKSGRMVFFGTLTGSKVTLDLSSAYLSHVSFIGTFRGSFQEFKELAELCRKCKPYTWREFSLEEGKDALLALKSPERKGRIMLKVT
ncbi:MAG: alcohol dehydrogenase catalytic domain-containing protein [Candidatus Aramenus sulfurataquae]|jgi:NADPH:quinone reductase-like Zn-dependent oxidoreductase|uniref:Alcohol dehydrogenase n=2 Tax=Candidatus Aramenus sulfurataquae TaxID=1326980 RepID=A0A0F2LRF9_9CREN|nr:alcohol dehydrogenase catalytic domain-containing protein [Candidatus Aramenus sulfurataquae]